MRLISGNDASLHEDRLLECLKTHVEMQYGFAAIKESVNQFMSSSVFINSQTNGKTEIIQV